MAMSGGSFFISDKDSIKAIHETLKAAIKSTETNSNAISKLTRAAVWLAWVQVVLGAIQVALAIL